jgi:hypothetical protein
MCASGNAPFPPTRELSFMEIGIERLVARVPDHVPDEYERRSIRNNSAPPFAAAVVHGSYVRIAGRLHENCRRGRGPRQLTAARGVAMRKSILSAALLVWVAVPAAAAPILTITPSTIALAPAQTVLTIDVDPNGTLVSTLLFNFSSLATGLEIVGVSSAEPGIIVVSGPAFVDPNYQASFSGFFFPERAAAFTAGTLTVRGTTAGTPLVVSGEFTDSLFNTIPIAPMAVALVSPEPGTASLVALGLLGLAFRGGRRSAATSLPGRCGCPRVRAPGSTRVRAARGHG